jgi:hypothetical protein
MFIQGSFADRRSSQKLRTRLALRKSLSSSEEQPHLQQPDYKMDDYYDSINANSKNRTGSPLLYQPWYQQVQQRSRA